jgi:polysaccharide biosynthesis protein PslG
VRIPLGLALVPVVLALGAGPAAAVRPVEVTGGGLAVARLAKVIHKNVAVQREAAGVRFDCIDASPADRGAVYARLSAAHVQWVRLALALNVLESAPGSYNKGVLASFGDCVDQAQAYGLRVLVPLVGTPPWAGSAWNAPPRDPETYAAAIGYLAARYPQVSAWEIWNEENIPRFWQGTVGQYVSLLRDAYAAVKEANPAALVVFGGTAHTDVGWIRSCYQAGARGYFDVMATHPYPRIHTNTDVAQLLGSTQSVRDVMLAYGDGGTPIWFTEFSWSQAAVGPQTQAQALTKSFSYIAANLPYVTAAFWFEAANEDSTVTPGSWQAGLSLLTPDLGFTPAFRALQQWAS